MSIHYFNTFISVAEDCNAQVGIVPPLRVLKLTTANVQYRMLVEEPYKHTQEDILFVSCATMRENPDMSQKEQAVRREEFFSKSQACLRASPMGKTYGWGVHFDEDGKAAAFGVETEEYKAFKSDPNLTQTRAMRSKR